MFVAQQNPRRDRTHGAHRNKIKQTMKKLFLLLTAATLFSCGGDDDNNTAPVIPNPTATAVAYFKGNNDGTPFNYVYNGLFNATHYYGFSHSSDGSNYIDYGSSMIPAGSNKPEYGVFFDNMRVNNFDDEPSEFYSLFAAPLPNNFLNAVQSSGHTKGIEVYYKDSSDNYFYSTYGSQAGSSISITSATQSTEAGSGRKTMIVTGTVSCKVYEFDNPTNYHTISGAQFKLIYRQFQD
jgi:hypothetical protein